MSTFWRILLPVPLQVLPTVRQNEVPQLFRPLLSAHFSLHSLRVTLLSFSTIVYSKSSSERTVCNCHPSINMPATDKKVAFNEIQILEFHYILGDNPAVSQGAPIALGNDLVNEHSLQLDAYESVRGKCKPRRKLALPVQTRAQM
jgi:hypothetical protein